MTSGQEMERVYSYNPCPHGANSVKVLKKDKVTHGNNQELTQAGCYATYKL